MNHWQRILSIIKYPQHVANDNKDLMLYQVSDNFLISQNSDALGFWAVDYFYSPPFVDKWFPEYGIKYRQMSEDTRWAMSFGFRPSAQAQMRGTSWGAWYDEVHWISKRIKGWVEHILLLCRILHRADVHLHYSWLRITFLQKNMFLQQKVSDRIQNFYLPNSAWNKPNAHRLKSTWLPNCEFRHGLWKYLNILATPQNTPSLAHHGQAVATPTQAACGKFCRPAVCRTKSTNARNSCYKFCSRTSWFPSSCFMPMHRWHFGGCSGIRLLFQPIRSSYIVLNIAPNHFQLHTRLYFAWTFWISSHQALFKPCPPFLSWNCCGLSSINSSGVAPRNQ